MSNQGDLAILGALAGIGSALEEILNDAAGERRGFALVVLGASEGPSGIVTNAPREEITTALRALLSTWEKEAAGIH